MPEPKPKRHFPPLPTDAGPGDVSVSDLLERGVIPPAAQNAAAGGVDWQQEVSEPAPSGASPDAALDQMEREEAAEVAAENKAALRRVMRPRAQAASGKGWWYCTMFSHPHPRMKDPLADPSRFFEYPHDGSCPRCPRCLDEEGNPKQVNAIPVKGEGDFPNLAPRSREIVPSVI